MGKVKKLLSKEEMDPRAVLDRTRLCVDLCENIHVHLRDMRLEFSLLEFRGLMELLNNSLDGINHRVIKGKWRLNESHDLVKQWKKTIDEESEYFPGRLQVELQQNGKIHVHYNNFRLDFVEDEFVKFGRAMAKAVGETLSVRQYRLSDLWVTVYRGRRKQFVVTPLRKSPFFRALVNNDEELYNEYRDRIFRNVPEHEGPTCCTWDEFQALVRSIKEDGFHRTSHINLETKRAIEEEYTVKEGHHRAAALLYCNGDIPVAIDGNTVYPLIPDKDQTYTVKFRRGGGPTVTRYSQHKDTALLDHRSKVRDTPWRDRDKPWTKYHIGKAQITTGEMQLLYEFAKRLGGNIANVGTYRGASSTVMAVGVDNNVHGGRVYAVDLYDGINGAFTLEEMEEDIKEKKFRDVIIPCMGYSHEVANRLAREGIEFNFVFIDADHHYETVALDIERWLPLVAKGGEVAFHDTDMYSVHKAILDHLPAEWEQIEHIYSTKVFKRK